MRTIFQGKVIAVDRSTLPAATGPTIDIGESLPDIYYDFATENPIGWPGTTSIPNRYFDNIDLNSMRKTNA